MASTEEVTVTLPPEFLDLTNDHWQLIMIDHD